MRTLLIALFTILGLVSSCNKHEKQNLNLKTEKMTIKFTDSKGNAISKEELSKATGTFNYEIYGIENVSDQAKLLHNVARQLGQSGKYTEAIEKLREAHKVAPKWPYPVYDMAYTYLLQGDFDNALRYYKLTDELAPRGFYTSKTALHTLEKEKTGEFQKGLYKSYLSLEWIQDIQEKKEIVQLLVNKFPTFAPAWKDYSSFLEGKERLEAIDKGLTANPDSETKGMLLINKALTINNDGDFDGAS